MSIFDGLVEEAMPGIWDFYQIRHRQSSGYSQAMQNWFSAATKHALSVSILEILCKSISCTIRNVEYMCFSYTNGCTFFCIIAYHLLGQR
jgi:hypothetical protein